MRPSFFRSTRARTWRAITVLLVAAALTGVTGPAADATAGKPASDWRIVDMGALGGPRNSNVYAVNDRDMAVGDSTVNSGASHAFLWHRGRMTDLGTLGGTDSWATDINNRGAVVGYSLTATGETHPFLWRAGRMTDLGTIAGTYGVATAINDRGDVVGFSVDTGQRYAEYPLLWRHGRMIRLPSLTADTLTRARDINNRGQIIGSNTLPGSLESVPVMWVAGKVHRLGDLEGFPEAINDRGDVIGSDGSQGGPTRGWLWSHGRVTDLRPGEPFHPFGINNRRQIVGACSGACIWQRGKLTTLPSPYGYGGEIAYDINASGQVVGYTIEILGGPFDARVHAVLWTRR